MDIVTTIKNVVIKKNEDGNIEVKYTVEFKSEKDFSFKFKNEKDVEKFMQEVKKIQ